MPNNKLKKQPKNAYFFFIMEMKDKKERGGTIVGNFQNAIKMFGHIWTAMTKEERAPYDLKAKEAKEMDKYNQSNKFTVTGESYAQVHRRELDQREVTEQMNDFIDRLATGSDATKRMYILIKMNHCVEEIIDKKRKMYWPNELGMVVFSLKDGIKSIYTQMIDTGASPSGYASQAKENCEERGMPVPGNKTFFSDSCRDYLQILKNINGFANHWLKEGYDTPGFRKVFFALEEDELPITTGLQWMVDKLDVKEKPKYQRFVNTLKVFNLPKLVLKMAEEANKINPSYSNYLVDFKLDTAAQAILTKGNYEYREEISCAYHRTDGSFKMNHCALSTVMRRVYLMFDEFMSAYRLERTVRHKIENISTKRLRGPILKKKMDKSPIKTQQSQQSTQAPVWMAVDNSDDWGSGSPPAEPDSSERWGQKSAQAASFGDSEFPSLSSTDPKPEAPSWARPPSSDSPPLGGLGRGRGRGMGGMGPIPAAAATPVSFMDDDFPALQPSSMPGRGRGRP